MKEKAAESSLPVILLDEMIMNRYQHSWSAKKYHFLAKLDRCLNCFQINAFQRCNKYHIHLLLPKPFIFFPYNTKNWFFLL